MDREYITRKGEKETLPSVLGNVKVITVPYGQFQYCPVLHTGFLPAQCGWP